MEPVNITLATPIERKKSLFLVLSISCTVLLMITLGLNLRIYFSLRSENIMIQAGIDRIRQEGVQKKRAGDENTMPGKDEIEKTSKRAAFLNTLIAKDIFPWVVVFDMLEKAVPENVALKSFSPEKDPKNSMGETIIRGRAKSVIALTVFMKNLDEQGLFKGNLLDTLGVSLDDTGDDSLGIRFMINGKLDIGEILQRAGLESNIVTPEAFK